MMKLFASALALSMSLLTTADDYRPILQTYSDIAHATFEDALISAQTLDKTLHALVDNPSAQTLSNAKLAWVAARVPYQQSEVFRFGNAIVDDWEGQVNAWPLDEGLIDYVATDYEHELGNYGANINIIANEQIQFGDALVDTSNITAELLAQFNEFAGSEANVATGYHAIEFLLWGQDLNGVNPGAGARSYTDYLLGAGCSNGACQRRGEYLLAVSQLLLEDLTSMTEQWVKGQANYRAELLAADPAQGITKVLFGMGSLALGELAGERMKVSLEANSTEDEHDCFSDNTHNSHYYDALGIQNIYLGRYQRIDGSLVTGASLSGLAQQKNAELNQQIKQRFVATESAMKGLVDKAEASVAPMKFDQMIAEGNTQGRQLVVAGIEALVAQTQAIEQLAGIIGIDSVNPETNGHGF